MGYRIEYGQTVKREHIDEFRLPKHKKIAICTAAFVIVALVFFYCLGVKSIPPFFLPGDPVVTGQALDAFAEQVREGEPFGNAAAAFCQKIISGADVS